MLCWLH